MGFFDKINNNTIVDTLKQLRNKRDCKIFCTNVPQKNLHRYIHLLHQVRSIRMYCKASDMKKMGNIFCFFSSCDV